jgi:tRNA G26 N,N-dimethylase Trm1
MKKKIELSSLITEFMQRKKSYYHPRLAIPRNCNIVMMSWIKKMRKNIIKLDALSSLDKYR